MFYVIIKDYNKLIAVLLLYEEKIKLIIIIYYINIATALNKGNNITLK